MLHKKTSANYKWVMLILCILMQAVFLGFGSSNEGLYTKPVTEALEIKRSVYSLSTSIRLAVQMLAALQFGNVVKRFGTKKTTFMGMVSLAASVLIRAYAINVYHLYIGGVLWGWGLVFAGGTMASTIIRRWFHKDVGKYTAIVMAASDLGGAGAAMVISPMINNGEVFGYRNAYLLSAIISAISCILVGFFFRERPAVEDPSEGATQKKQLKGALWKGIPYETAKKKPYFYLMAAMMLLTGIGLQSVGSASIVHMTDVGMSAGALATVVTLYSVCVIFSKMLLGILYDKRGLRTTLLVCLLAAMVSYGLYGCITNPSTGFVLAIIATIPETFALPIQGLMIPLISNDMFGSASYEKVLGVFTALTALGGCLGAPLAHLLFDIFGTYLPCFWIFVGSMAVISVGYLAATHAAHADRSRMES